MTKTKIDSICANTNAYISTLRLFRPFVTQIIETIEYLEKVGCYYQFTYSHSQFSGRRSRILLMPGAMNFCIGWDDESLHIIQRGFRLPGVDTPEAVLAFVKEQLDLPQ